MKNGAQKDLKIHEKWALGHSWVDLLGPRGDFGGCRKIIDFLIALGSAKKREKWSRGVPRGDFRTIGCSESGGQQRSGVHGAASRGVQ